MFGLLVIALLLWGGWSLLTRIPPVRRLREEKAAARQRARIRAIEEYRPAGYGTQRELVWPIGGNLGYYLDAIRREGIYETVSVTPVAQANAPYAVTHHAHLRAVAVNVGGAEAREVARKKIDIDPDDGDLLLAYCEPGSTLAEPSITAHNYRRFVVAQAEAERRRRLTRQQR